MPTDYTGACCSGCSLVRASSTVEEVGATGASLVETVGADRPSSATDAFDHSLVDPG